MLFTRKHIQKKLTLIDSLKKTSCTNVNSSYKLLCCQNLSNKKNNVKEMILIGTFTSFLLFHYCSLHTVFQSFSTELKSSLT